MAFRPRGRGGIDNPDRRLNRFGDHLSGVVAASGYELPGDQGNEFGWR